MEVPDQILYAFPTDAQQHGFHPIEEVKELCD
jgi:hypothetical protein